MWFALYCLVQFTFQVVAFRIRIWVAFISLGSMCFLFSRIEVPSYFDLAMLAG